MLNKSSEAAIAAMSRLAEVYDGGKTLLTAQEIAQARNLQKPFVAKLLTQLSQAGLISGAPGRKGGYFLARTPETITLKHIADCFERRHKSSPCPFGPGYCGSSDAKCPVHDDIMAMQDRMNEYLENTKLSVFVKRD